MPVGPTNCDIEVEFDLGITYDDDGRAEENINHQKGKRG